MDIENVFESSVISYGSEAKSSIFITLMSFESSVISYGSEANNESTMWKL